MRTSTKVLAALGIIAVLAIVGLSLKGGARVAPLAGGVKAPLEEKEKTGKRQEGKSSANKGELSKEKKVRKESVESADAAESGREEHAAVSNPVSKVSKKKDSKSKNGESGQTAPAEKASPKREELKRGSTKSAESAAGPLRRVESVYPVAAATDKEKIVVFEKGIISVIDRKTGKVEKKEIYSGDLSDMPGCGGLFFAKGYLYALERKPAPDQPLRVVRRNRDLSDAKVIWTAPVGAGFSTFLYDDEAMYIPMYDNSAAQPGCSPFAWGESMSLIKVRLSDGKETVLAKTAPGQRGDFTLCDARGRQVLVVEKYDITAEPASLDAVRQYRYECFLADVDKEWPKKPLAKDMRDGVFTDDGIHGLFVVGHDGEGHEKYAIERVGADGSRAELYAFPEVGKLIGRSFSGFDPNEPNMIVDLKDGKLKERNKTSWEKGSTRVSIDGECGDYWIVLVSRDNETSVGFMLKSDFDNETDRVLRWR